MSNAGRESVENTLYEWQRDVLAAAVSTNAQIQGDDAVMQRLLEMGLFEGEELEVVAVAPLGDPLEIQLRDYRLSLRRSEAARILVVTLP